MSTMLASSGGQISGSAEGALDEACDRMTRELMDGVRHGFFEMTVAVETMASKKRRILIKAGKSHQFIVREEEVPAK
jgi:hypothetical protein